MNTPRTRINVLKDLLRGLTALSVLAGLVAGVPAALAVVAGWPLPRAVPHFDAIGRALSQTDMPDGVLVKGAACVCWLAWAALMVCVVVELIAWLRCSTARRLPFLGPFQVSAARLVASAVLLFSSFAGLVHPAAAASLHPAGLAAVHMTSTRGQNRLSIADAAESGPEATVVSPGTPETPMPAGAKHYTVQPDRGRRYDTLWSLAERHLGDPRRWTEIANLNQGRVSAGHRFRNPHWIFAGEQLVMPADAVGLDAVPAGQRPAPSVTQPPVDPVPAEQRAPAATDQAPSTASSSVDMRVLPDGHSQREAAVKSPQGWRLVHVVSDLVPARVSVAEGIGGGILAAGAIAMLESRRRTRQRRRLAGGPCLVPDEELAATELALRVAADVDGAELVAAALKLVERAASPSDVLGVRLGRRQVTIRFCSAPLEITPPFRLVGDDWVLPRRAITTALLGELGDRPAVDLPLITLGATDDDDTVLLNLRASTVTSVVGSREVVLAFLAAAATELATARWLQSGRLLLVGVVEDLAGLPGVTVVPAVGHVGELRSGDVVVSAEPPGRLADAMPAGSSLLAVGPMPGPRCRLIIGDGRLEANVLDAVVRPQTLAPESVADIGELLEPVAEPAGHVAVEEEVADEDVPPATSAPVVPLTVGDAMNAAVSAEDIRPPEIDVRVLGPVDIVGADKPLARAKSVELIVYLAMHRQAIVDADRLREALWPGRPPGTTLYTTASVARNHLGRGSDGELHLPLVANGERVYRLGGAVGSDYARFADYVHRAKSEPPMQARASLRAALQLVRGRPFDVSTRGYEWAHVEGFITCIENEVATAAHQLARLCLEAGDADGARWATRRGLRACPGHEQLFRDEMEAADLEGNTAGVQALMTELRHIVEEDSPLDSLHPETVSLYTTLTSRERAARLTA